MLKPNYVSTRSPEDLRELLATLAATLLAVIIIATLYFGRSIFIPLALAILLSFVLAPLVALLRKVRVPSVAAVLAVVFLAFAGIFGLGGLMANQLSELAADLPTYQYTMREKIQSLRGAAGSSSTLERAASILQDLSDEIDRPQPALPATPMSPAGDEAPAAKPIPVEIHQPEPGALENLRSLIAPLLTPIATTGLIIVFVIFILLQRVDLRNRLIRLAGARDIQRTTAALDDGAARLSRLFLTQLAVNSTLGVTIAIGLMIIGVPSAILWGILAGALRFVPYIGAPISAVFPLALAAAVDPGWSMVLWTLALFVVFEPVAGQVVEPMLYGRSTGLSPVAIVVSATFWTALWGPIGLVLATPLTVCLVVLGRHVDRLSFLDVMFGDRPALSPPEIFYQRMLAGDPAEAAEKAEEFLKERSLSSYYEDVALKGLLLAQADGARGALDELRLNKIRFTVGELVDDLDDHDDVEPKADGSTQDAEAGAAVDAVPDSVTTADLPVLTPENLPVDWRGASPVLCVGGRTPLDESAADILAQVLGKHGLPTNSEGAATLSPENIRQLRNGDIRVVCLCYLDAGTPAHISYTVKRLRRWLPKAGIFVGCWTTDDGDAALDTLRQATTADAVAGSLREMTRLCIERVGPLAAPVPPADGVDAEAQPALVPAPA